MADEQTFWNAIAWSPILASAAVGFVAGMIGGYLSHRWALGRDKRKEYNEKIENVRQLLKLERDRPRPYSNALARLDKLDGLDPLLGPFQRIRLRRARTRYEKLLRNATQEKNSSGEELLTGDESQISDCAAELLRILKPR